MLLITLRLDPKELVKFNIFVHVNRVFAKQWFKDLILCYDVNILDDLKIVDSRNVSLMQQTASFLCLFLTIIMLYGYIMYTGF